MQFTEGKELWNGPLVGKTLLGSLSCLAKTVQRKRADKDSGLLVGMAEHVQELALNY